MSLNTRFSWEHSNAGVAPAPAPGTTTDDMRDLVIRFESLGGWGHGCEFGIFQRDIGAEPLSLLRWSDLNAGALTDALNDRFEGVGSEEFTIVFEPAAGSHGEWWTKDSRYHMAMRTFIKVSEVPYDRVVPLICKRLQFLRRKLIADLEHGEKIFVYRSLKRPLTQNETSELHKAVADYGDNMLLLLRLCDNEHSDGDVKVVGPGLMMGYLDHFTFSPEDELIGTVTDSLLKVCAAAERLHAAAVPAKVPARPTAKPARPAASASESQTVSSTIGRLFLYEGGRAAGRLKQQPTQPQAKPRTAVQ